MFTLDLLGVCVFDNKNDRVLSGHYFASEKMTVELCLSTCRQKGFRYSGLQWQIECFCGNEPNQFVWAWPNKCNDRCAGNSYQICGGSSSLSVYSTPRTNFDGLCIYNYPSPRQILNDKRIAGYNNMTIDYCRTICEGIGYFDLIELYFNLEMQLI